MAFGLPPARAGPSTRSHATRSSESPLWQDLVLARRGGSRWGYFLLARVHARPFTYLERDAGRGRGTARPQPRRVVSSTSCCPASTPPASTCSTAESALSFDSILALLAHLLDLLRPGGAGSVIMAHALPVLAALPGAEILELARRASTAPAGRTSDGVEPTNRRFLPVRNGTCATSRDRDRVTASAAGRLLPRP